MRTSFHYQPEAQHPNSSAIHKPPADYPIFGALSGLTSDIIPGPGCAMGGDIRLSNPQALSRFRASRKISTLSRGAVSKTASGMGWP
jgi:hypothetical protein